VINQDFANNTYVNNVFATQAWVTQQLQGSGVGVATQAWVTAQGYALDSRVTLIA
jgi:hypothetical protein